MATIALDTPLISTGEYTLTLGHLVSASIIIIGTFVLSMVVRRALKRFEKKDLEITNAQIYALSRLLHYVILVSGFLVAISSLGIPVGKLALVASALGVGIGLGLQGIVNNFVCGLAILLEKSLRVGDFIELGTGTVGEVKEIHMRATLVRTNDNVDMLIPNSELVNSQVTNWTLVENTRRFRIPFGVAYGSDKEQVKKAALEAAQNVPYTLNDKGKQPAVWMTGFADSSLNFVLAVWVSPEQVKRPSALTSDYLWALDDAFRKYEIQIPFPQRDIHIKQPRE
ncbi:MAG: mechanosensitive ion channel [Pseudomonadales bacterium]|nr:mechanosensitive ion channel [Pseudomonadales bacterium]